MKLKDSDVKRGVLSDFLSECVNIKLFYIVVNDVVKRRRKYYCRKIQMKLTFFIEIFVISSEKKSFFINVSEIFSFPINSQLIIVASTLSPNFEIRFIALAIIARHEVHRPFFSGARYSSSKPLRCKMFR